MKENHWVNTSPVRTLRTDDPLELLTFARASFRGGGVAIAMLVGIRGGAARALGSQVVVTEEGEFAGFVSGGCVEAAVAAEALLAISEGRDRSVLYGEGSPFFDIVLPCGGGITVAIHVLRDIDAIDQVIACLDKRGPAGLAYSPQQQTLRCVASPEQAGWRDDTFVSVYRPVTRVVISGGGIEAERVALLAECSGYDAVVLDPSRAAEGLDGVADAYSAIVLLHHDLDAELPFLEKALNAPGFYLGALGSTRTHRKRIERLRGLGFSDEDVARIKAPIGLFGPAREASSLAISVLADVAATRLATFV
ncbi:xanthine dehydrogenase accessory factor [Alloalcanivorax xenomutans]|uniref:XdhC family protein n=1 Tax=Alloalcanivorax xenomutans TaxID=1094342 RepID=UPI000BCA84CF|nr:XdhC family protein [Alloalcanivorax xenomutans]SOC24772.1 xanthine dehydrogenase accessory factor [Alloalcanivorax xenomutans]